MKKISIIIPVFQEAEALHQHLPLLQSLRALGHEVIVVDGAGDAAGQQQFASRVDHWLPSPAGRARQMNAGAALASGDILVFLHIDTRLPPDAATLLLQGFASPRVLWGRFDVRLSGERPVFRVIETMMNLRSRVTGVATGDQAIFLRRLLFRQLGGFPELPLMEDIAFSKILRKKAPPLCLRARVVTSSRRWEANGVLRTICLMWWLRLLYVLGVSPLRLRDMYLRKALSANE